MRKEILTMTVMTAALFDQCMRVRCIPTHFLMKDMPMSVLICD